ncbi:ATPase [Hylemonella gracilis]|uniref:ATPase n=1 Tax=Hylemonella gracilis TaxID=80880 RepID=A0A4P6UH88_9BURK|nr:AAA family ATPase [Hylemonella gracilis]QBK04648.1 ATPase [Hylemonella gracilis]
MDFTIERFKNIEQVQLSVDGIDLLVGGNNAGKSSILQALQFGVSAAQTAAIQGGAWVGNRLSTSIGQSDLVYAPIKDVLSLARNGKLREREDEAIQITYKDGDDACRVTVRKGRNKNILIEVVGRTLGTRLQSVTEPYSALVTGLAGIPAEERFEANIVVRKAAAKGDSNSVFRNILLQLSQAPEKWAAFQQQIEMLFPGYAIQVSYDPNIDEVINCHVERGATQYPIDTCGTGVLQAIQIFAYVNLFAPRLLLLDEPDSHLHPNNQKLLAGALANIAERGTKIVLCSHSKHIIAALADAARFVWLRDGRQEVETDKYEVQALVEIGALNAGERLGNPTHIFLTEDASHDILELLLEASGYDLEQCEIMSYSGCTQIATATALISHLRRTAPNARYVLHRDRDFLPADQLAEFSAKFARMQVSAFLPTGNDLESFFLTREHLAATCAVTVEVADEVLSAAFNTRRAELTAKYVNTVVENQRRAGERPNSGEIAVECANLLTGPHSPAAHGKVLLKAVRDELRNRGIADRLLSLSDHIRIAELVALHANVGAA